MKHRNPVVIKAWVTERVERAEDGFISGVARYQTQVASGCACGEQPLENRPKVGERSIRVPFRPSFHIEGRPSGSGSWKSSSDEATSWPPDSRKHLQPGRARVFCKDAR
jgi:hypothetical protein